jgi:arginase
MSGMPVELLCVPYDSGRRGWRMGAGPQALLRQGLVQSLRKAGRDVELVPIESAGAADPADSAFDLAARVARVVRAAKAGGRLPVVLAGNCITTLGVMAGAADADTELLWLDAHADLNTPDTSTSGFLDGMAAATILGWCHTDRAARLDGFAPLAETHFVLAGARDIDPPEQQALERAAIRVIPAQTLRTDPDAARARDGRAIFIHLDLDVLDSERAGAANSYATTDGLSADELVAVLRAACANRRVVGMTVSAYDPAIDADGRAARAALAAIETVVAAAGSAGAAT